jgi:hypothetical protein
MQREWYEFFWIFRVLRVNPRPTMPNQRMKNHNFLKFSEFIRVQPGGTEYMVKLLRVTFW